MNKTEPRRPKKTSAVSRWFSRSLTTGGSGAQASDLCLERQDHLNKFLRLGVKTLT